MPGATVPGEYPASLAEAMARFQANLPEVLKGETAKVDTTKGPGYKYSYANLPDVSRTALRLLGALGVSWLTKPTVVDGRFVLAYKLLHVSGEYEAGEYPLPANATPQAVGSAITYARRYALLAITGVAPDDDDDGQAAQQEYDHERRRPEPREQQRVAPSTRARELFTAIAAAANLDDLYTQYQKIGPALDAQEISRADADQLDAHVRRRKAELTPADASAPALPMIADSQKRRMRALWKDAGYKDDRQVWLDRLAELAGLDDLASSNDLTHAQAQQIITALEAEKKALRQGLSA